MVTDDHACTAGDSIRLVSLTSEGILSNAEVGIRIYPNPVDELLRIELEQSLSDEGLILELFSASNVLMIQKKVDQGQTGELMLNVQHLTPGTYMLRIRAGKDHYHRLVVVE
jgi:hypothetical protein